MNQQTSGRIHALDNLRACMMWLGIVLHVAVNHLTGPSLLPFKDRDLSLFADLILIFIHAFRMPVFFVLAGFLAAMMVDTRGYQAMLRNRVRRLALPFVVFWPLLFIGLGLLVVVYRHLMALGTLGFDTSLMPRPQPGHSPFNTMHLWFVYDLFILCLIGGGMAAIARFLPARLLQGAQTLLTALARRWWGFAVLAIPLAIVGTGYRAGILAQTGSFIPRPDELTHYGMFFLIGWVIYRARDEVLAHYARRCWAYAGAGLLTYCVSGALFQVFIKDPASIAHIDTLIAYVYGSTGWLWSMALIGAYVRYLPTQNRVLRYLSDSSYWVFLVHMLGTMGFGVLLYNAPFGALPKMAVNVLATTVACLISYQFLVRRTWLGVLLNGKRQPRRLHHDGSGLDVHGESAR
ncbi:MAG: acyltransferase family protein [Massilia sp.]